MPDVETRPIQGSADYSPARKKLTQRILLVTGTFAPELKVGALRTERLARTLAGAGHDVTVLTPRLASDESEVRLCDPAYRVITVDVGDRYATRLLRHFRRFGIGNGSGAFSASGVETGTNGTGESPGRTSSESGLRSFFLALMAVPDVDQNCILPTLSAARRWKRGDFDMVYSSAPPFSVHVAAERIARRLGVPLLLEYRDPWNHAYTERIATQHALTRWIDLRLERRCLESAREVVAVSHGAAEVLRNMPNAPPVHVCLNGVPGELLQSRRPLREGRINLLYAGALYQQRDPMPFLQALSLVVRRTGWTPEQLGLEFLGECRRFAGFSVEAMVAEAGLAGYVTFRDRVPHDEATQTIANADLLLLLVQGQPTQIPNKLYDYLAMRVPIIAYSDSRGETSRMLQEAGGHLILNEQGMAEQADALESLISSRMADRNVPVGDPAVLERWRSDRQMEQLLETLSL